MWKNNIYRIDDVYFVNSNADYEDLSTHKDSLYSDTMYLKPYVRLEVMRTAESEIPGLIWKVRITAPDKSIIGDSADHPGFSMIIKVPSRPYTTSKPGEYAWESLPSLGNNGCTLYSRPGKYQWEIYDGEGDMLYSTEFTIEATKEQLLQAKLEQMKELQKAGLAGDSEKCEKLAGIYMDTDHESLGITVYERSKKAIDWYYRAANDKNYRNRGYCAKQIAFLYFIPRYEYLNLKAAEEWFVFAGGLLSEGECFINAGRIAEYGKEYEKAIKYWLKADELSKGHDGAAEIGRMYIDRNLGEETGQRILYDLAYYSDNPAACIYWAEVLRSELALAELAHLDNDIIKDRLQEDFNGHRDAWGEAAFIEYNKALEALPQGKTFSCLEDEAFFKMMTDAAYVDESDLAIYRMGIIYENHFNRMNEYDDSKIRKNYMSCALNCYKEAADAGVPKAMRAYGYFYAVLYGYCAEAEKYFNMATKFGEENRFSEKYWLDYFTKTHIKLSRELQY